MTASWRDRIKVHPAADLFPMMTDAELDELAADIKKNGLRHKVVFYSDSLIDGRNRLEAMERAGLGLPSDVDCEEEGDPYAYVASVNLHRRHLTGEQKREVIAKLLKANPERSDRETAKLAGSNRNTVGRVRSDLERSGEVSLSDTRTGSDGVAQPAHKPTMRPLITAPAASLSSADAEPVPPVSKALGSLNALLRVDPAKGLLVIQQALHDAPLSEVPKEKRIAKARSFLDALGVEAADLLPIPTVH